MVIKVSSQNLKSIFMDFIKQQWKGWKL